MDDARIRELARLAIATLTPQDFVLATDGAITSPGMERLFRTAIAEQREANARKVHDNSWRFFSEQHASELAAAIRGQK